MGNSAHNASLATQPESGRPLNWPLAAFAYFATVFAAGFALGFLRNTVIVPRFGEALATALELPVILAFSWCVCRAIMRRLDKLVASVMALAIGSSAFLMLQLAELMLSVFQLGRSVIDHVALYATLPVQIGLLGQIIFGLFPLLFTLQQRQHDVSAIGRQAIR